MFVENYFLIEAYAMDMTDKLAIVKAFSCGASLTACVLFVWAFLVFVAVPWLYPDFTFKLTNTSRNLPLQLFSSSLNIKNLFAPEVNVRQVLQPEQHASQFSCVPPSPGAE